MQEYDIQKNNDGSYTVSEHVSSGNFSFFIGAVVVVVLIIWITNLIPSKPISQASGNANQAGSVAVAPAPVDTTTPKALNTLKVIDETWDLDHYKNSTISDNYGNEYIGYYDFAACDCPWSGYAKEEYVRLKANGNWQYVSGTYFPRNWRNGDYYVRLSIYADDKLVYQGNWMTLDSKPVSFDVDIGYCDVLKLSVTSKRTEDMPGTTPGIDVVLGKVHN